MDAWTVNVQQGDLRDESGLCWSSNWVVWEGDYTVQAIEGPTIHCKACIVRSKVVDELPCMGCGMSPEVLHSIEGSCCSSTCMLLLLLDVVADNHRTLHLQSFFQNLRESNTFDC